VNLTITSAVLVAVWN